jgi:hypothetical protein
MLQGPICERIANEPPVGASGPAPRHRARPRLVARPSRVGRSTVEERPIMGRQTQPPPPPAERYRELSRRRLVLMRIMLESVSLDSDIFRRHDARVLALGDQDFADKTDRLAAEVASTSGPCVSWGVADDPSRQSLLGSPLQSAPALPHPRKADLGGQHALQALAEELAPPPATGASQGPGLRDLRARPVDRGGSHRGGRQPRPQQPSGRLLRCHASKSSREGRRGRGGTQSHA